MKNTFHFNIPPMGINGLLPLLKPCIQTVSIKKFRNKTLGVDGHSWLYMLGTIIAYELYNDIETEKYIPLLEQKLKLYQKQNIKLIFVFDGNTLPSKSTTNDKRIEKKEEIKEKIQILIRNKQISKAKHLMKQCISIKPFFLKSMINYLKKQGIEYILSPYESDAQLTYLQRIEYIDGILTEDSDFIPYGCTNILYKSNGEKAEMFNREKLNTVNDIDKENLLNICILSGCDYLKNINRVGLKTAIKYFNTHKTISHVIYALRSNNFEVPEDYEEEFQRAILTFKHQVVYCPISKRRVYLSKSEDLENMEFLGKLIDKDIEFINISIDREETTSKYFQ